MAANRKGMGFALMCTLLMVQGVRAENCRVSVSQPRIDYGVIRKETLAPSASFALGTRTVHLSVLCAEPSAMALRFVGAADGQGFRFGREGRFRLTLKHAQVDGHPVVWGAAHLPGEAASGQLLPGQVLVAPVAGNRLTPRSISTPSCPPTRCRCAARRCWKGRVISNWSARLLH